MKIFLLSIVIFCYYNAVTAQVNQTDAKGLKQGPWQKNYPGTTVPQYKGSFLNDKPVGKFTYYFESGEKKAEMQHGLPGGFTAVLLYFENGQVLADGFYKGEKKDSLWYNYAPTGELISAENYKLDQLHGKCVYYYKEGQYLEQKLQIHKKVNYTNGKLDGTYQEYFYNGKLKLQGVYQLGEKKGLWTEYYNTGNVMAKVHYQRDLLHGWMQYYDKAGNLQSKVMYRDGYALDEKETKAFLERCKVQNLDPNQ
ncbi:MAG: toxin-antitoxin system YwqK family antitoxin [Flavobacteriales bacterium]